MTNAFGLFCYSTSFYLRVTECIFPEAKLKVVSLWNWPKQELREKNWSAMEALSATESMLQGKLSKAVKVRHPTSVCFTLVPIWCIPPKILLIFFFFCHDWPSEISFPPSSITKLHTHLPHSRPSPLLFGLKFWIGCALSCWTMLLPLEISDFMNLTTIGFFSGYILALSSEIRTISPCPKLRLMLGNECAVT